MLRDAIHQIVQGQSLSSASMRAAVGHILSGEASPVQMSAFLIGLRMKGETTEELAAAALEMRARSATISAQIPGTSVDRTLLDTCGTGGDGADTFNISTVSAIVVAACGVAVAKHGNRAVSSRAGSADVLEALGVRIDRSPEDVARCIRELNIGFLFAPAHHAAMRHAAPIRRELGVRTLFNLLGPLANPAEATHQLVGVYDAQRVTQLAEVLGRLGSTAAWVVHGDGGLDEISPCGPTQVAEIRASDSTANSVRTFEVTPEDFGLARVPPSELQGGDADENARIARAILGGAQGGARSAVLINAGAALVVAGAVSSLREGASRAAEAIDSGRAERTLAAWREATQASV